MILENITQREEAYIRQVVSDLYGVSPISWQYVGKNLPINNEQPLTGVGGNPTSIKWRTNYNVDPSTFEQTILLYWVFAGFITAAEFGYTDFYTWITTGGTVYKTVGSRTIKMTPVFTNLTTWHINFEINTTSTYTYGTINQKVGGIVADQQNVGNVLYDNIQNLYIGKITKTSSASGINYTPFSSLIDKMKGIVNLSHYAPERYNVNAFNLICTNYDNGDYPRYAWFNGYEIYIPKIGPLSYTNSTKSVTLSLNNTLP